MPENLLAHKNIIIGVIVAIVALGGGGYFVYTKLFPAADPAAPINQAILSGDIVAFMNAKDKIKISSSTDAVFLKSGFYPLLVDHTEVVNPNPTRGRPDPFIPYAPTGPIR
jgi:hypothetical protein